jgi:hypothetical protein
MDAQNRAFAAAWSTSPDPHVAKLQLSFLIALGAFCICIVIARSRKSFFDVIATRNVCTTLKIAVTFECLSNILLLVMATTRGTPITIGAVGAYGGNDANSSWTYGIARPIVGMILIGMGGIAEMHSGPRFACIAGCMVQIVFDGLSALQVGVYIGAQDTQKAPMPPGFTRDWLEVYYWRDLVSFGLAFLIMLFCIFLSINVGVLKPWVGYQYMNITGHDLDRPLQLSLSQQRRDELLREQEDVYSEMEEGGLVIPDRSFTRIDTDHESSQKDLRDGGLLDRPGTGGSSGTGRFLSSRKEVSGSSRGTGSSKNSEGVRASGKYQTVRIQPDSPVSIRARILQIGSQDEANDA